MQSMVGNSKWLWICGNNTKTLNSLSRLHHFFGIKNTERNVESGKRCERENRDVHVSGALIPKLGDLFKVLVLGDVEMWKILSLCAVVGSAWWPKSGKRLVHSPWILSGLPHWPWDRAGHCIDTPPHPATGRTNQTSDRALTSWYLWSYLWKVKYENTLKNISRTQKKHWWNKRIHVKLSIFPLN